MCSAILAHYWLNEKLNIFGILGCVLCIVGSITIVLHAPEEREITSLLEVWQLALQPGDLRRPCIVLSDIGALPATDLLSFLQFEFWIFFFFWLCTLSYSCIAIALLHPVGMLCRFSAIYDCSYCSHSLPDLLSCAGLWHDNHFCLCWHLLFGRIFVGHELQGES